MKNFFLISSLILLVGCSDKLDTSQLTNKQDNKNSSIKFYAAPSAKVAIEALPYEVTLPSKLPFDSDEFNSLGITDIGGQGLNADAQFMASDKKNNQLLLSTSTGTVEYPKKNPEEITLKSGYKAYYTEPESLDVIVDNVTYSFTLIMPEQDDEYLKQALIKLAEQL
ncbi:hypothetical protein PB01_02440 [Psychrobacillus glaciei]|uniref:DUF4367 domain-containing protein n=1 Tax=Psychrobacillus glaciei TaxID=2283160 RepID=A0A5J6SIG9_9BACI|nr:hypothetical protein [Psychrobacillus glaciei]QFF97760.1 hypothetical protein PB01_02440 [Psychrobacillus glaciei]